MSGNRKVTSNILFVIIFIAILVSAFFVYNHFTKKTFNAFDAIPPSTSFFMDFHSLNTIRQELNTNKMWAELKKLEALDFIDSHYDLFDSVASLHPQLAAFIQEGKGILSVHTKEGKSHVLLVLETGHQLGYSLTDGVFDEIYGNGFTRLQSNFQGEKVKKIIFNKTDNTFSYALIGNLFLGSTSEDLVKETIKHLQKNQSILNNPDLKSLNRSAGKNVDANIYLNYTEFSTFLSEFTAENHKPFAQKASKYSAWTGLDLILKEDELLLNGYTKAADSSNHFLALYYKQLPQPITLTGILPYNTSLMVHYGFENYQVFFEDYKNYLKAHNKYESFRKKVNNLNISLKTNLEHLIIPQIGSEAALVSYATKPSEFYSQTYAIIKTKDLQESRRRWGQIHSRVSGSGLVKHYKGFEIFRINRDGILEVIFGESFNPITKFNYIFLNGFMVVANSSQALESFIDLYQSGKTLDLNENYKSFIDNVYQESNFYLYCNIRNGFNLLQKYLAPGFFDQLNSPQINFTNFHAAGFQISNIQGNLFTNIYLKYNAEIVEENRSIWKANLDSNIKGQPYTVKNHRNNTYNIVVFDVENNMYLFDSDGNRLWKRQISEAIQSPVHLVDFYKNGKYQYLFNTQNYLHLIDLLGRNVEGYPRKLTSPATNGVSVFDYENKKNYRLLIAGSDKKIYNYNIKGNEVTGWNKAQTLNIVNTELQHLVSNRRDYILVTDNDGVVKILNRLGNDRIILKRQFKKATQSDFYINQTNEKGLFLTTNTKGTLTYIASSGAISETSFGNFSNQHYFLYEDFNKNGHKDFIYLDNNKLRIYDRFKKPIFTYEFKTNINQKPVFYNISNTQSLLGIVSHESQEIFLFDKSGKVVISKGLIGETPFVIRSLKNNRKLNLVVGTGTSLYNYVIK